MNSKKFSKYKIYHYTSCRKDKQANAAFLMGAFMIIILEKTAEEAWEIFKPYHASFKPFRDASPALDCSYRCTIEDCLQGLEFAMKLGWYNYKDFNVKEYEFYEKVYNGDMNWIVPGKFLAFSSPSQTKYDSDGYRTYTPECYAPIFDKLNVTCVVRLNNKSTYDRERFLKKGI